MTDQAVRVEQSGPVSTVFLHRPARRNAVDGPTAAQLAAAFRGFDADPGAAVAVLHGERSVSRNGRLRGLKASTAAVSALITRSAMRARAEAFSGDAPGRAAVSSRPAMSAAPSGDPGR